MDRSNDRALKAALTSWPSVTTSNLEALLERAEYHGLAGVMSAALVSAGFSVDARFRLREAAREIDHSAHLCALVPIDQAFSNAGVPTVALKGALFAERYYPKPAARVTGDTDLLVREADLDIAGRLLEAVGYRGASGPEEDRYRREHHHLHFSHPRALPLELHFHAYRGFGRTLHSEPLLARSLPFRDFRALRVLAPDDEIVYLATHAAAHKFGRWSWLFDLRLLIDTLDDDTIRAAGAKARELGFARPVALAARLLVSIMGMDARRLAPLGVLGPVRGLLAERLLATPTHPVPRALTRLAYSTALCSDSATSVRWVARETVRRGREELAKLPLLRALA